MVELHREVYQSLPQLGLCPGTLHVRAESDRLWAEGLSGGLDGFDGGLDEGLSSGFKSGTGCYDGRGDCQQGGRVHGVFNGSILGERSLPDLSFAFFLPALCRRVGAGNIHI